MGSEDPVALQPESARQRAQHGARPGLGPRLELPRGGLSSVSAASCIEETLAYQTRRVFFTYTEKCVIFFFETYVSFFFFFFPSSAFVFPSFLRDTGAEEYLFPSTRAVRNATARARCESAAASW